MYVYVCARACVRTGNGTHGLGRAWQVLLTATPGSGPLVPCPLTVLPLGRGSSGPEVFSKGAVPDREGLASLGGGSLEWPPKDLSDT